MTYLANIWSVTIRSEELDCYTKRTPDKAAHPFLLYEAAGDALHALKNQRAKLRAASGSCGALRI